MAHRNETIGEQPAGDPSAQLADRDGLEEQPAGNQPPADLERKQGDGQEEEEEDLFEGHTTREQAFEDAWCLRYFRFPAASTFIEGMFISMNSTMPCY